jgi:hypothetical protein
MRSVIILILIVASLAAYKKQPTAVQLVFGEVCTGNDRLS